MSWQPTAPIANLKARAEVLYRVREFFRKREVIEVQTPVLGEATVSDVNIHSMEVPGRGFLQTSPEFAMKRLLASGMPSCYQIAPVFRDNEQGRWHNPEFTMLEWYRLGFSMQQLIKEVKDLLNEILGTDSYVQTSVQEFLTDYYKLDLLNTEESKCLDLAVEKGLLNCTDHELAIDFLLDQALSTKRISRLIVTDFPVYSAALAKIKQIGNTQFAARFEVVIDGLEVANGYDELQDAKELERRIRDDNARRALKRLPVIEADQHLLKAMDHGLPQCAGVAVGLDRVVALKLGESSIDRVLSFRSRDRSDSFTQTN